MIFNSLYTSLKNEDGQWSPIIRCCILAKGLAISYCLAYINASTTTTITFKTLILCFYFYTRSLCLGRRYFISADNYV